MKLWKHHAAQPEADRINAVAAERGEPWLPRYGGRISSEWFFAKALQILDEAPEVYARADRLIEACDWIVWQLTGVESRSACAAGYKAMWSKRDGFPSPAYFAALDPRFEHVVDEKLSRVLLPPGARAGGLSERAAAWTGLRAGTPVAVGNVDFHGSVPATTVTAPGTLVMIMGTSNGHLVLGDELVEVEGMCGVVEDGDRARLLRLRGRPVGARRHLRVVHAARRAARVPRGGARARASTCTTCSRRRRPRFCRGSPACLRSTGGTATAPCSSTPTCRGCSWA